MSMDEKRINHLMDKLTISREDAIQLLKDDEVIDRLKDSEVNNDLTPEQKATVKKARQADRAPTVYKFTKRERKKDNVKADIVNLIFNALQNEVATDSSEVLHIDAQNIEITNPERELTFTVDGRKFKIVLSAPRS
jgi:hypothetical protein